MVFPKQASLLLSLGLVVQVAFVASGCATDDEIALSSGAELESSGAELSQKMGPPILTPIYFATNRAQVREHHWRELFILAQYLKFTPKSKLEIEGHTDLTGKEAGNKELGYQRAIAVKELLVYFGAPLGQLFTIGLGEHCPAIAAKTPLGLKFNRRVEFVLRLGEPKDAGERGGENFTPTHFSRCF
jgi:outer membrane protein OmpA-like peptidoglycan-associated protein